MVHTKYLSGLAGGLTFAWIYGLQILDPKDIAWLLKGDSATYFLGWHFFRQEEWAFPLGAIKAYQYPFGTSVVYTGSVPLLTIPLKLISSFLPDIFQFHGIWLLICYVLQGFFGALLFSRITSNRIIIFMGSLFFILNPILVQRSGYHLGNASHWLILAGLYLYFGHFNKADKCKWILLLVASTLVNFYILAMLLVIWSAYLVKSWVENRSSKGMLTHSVAAFFSILFSMWVVGYFVLNPGKVGSIGFGIYSMNLISPFNPAPYDHFTFLKPSIIALAQYEGFSYLGFGALALLVFALLAGVKGKIKIDLVKSLPIFGACLVLSILAISNKVQFADTVLFTVKLPEFLMGYLSIIRASGRMFWPVIYMIIFASFLVLVIRYDSRKTTLIILAALILQVIDFYPWYRRVDQTTIDERVITSHVWENLFPLKSASWKKISNHAKHIIFIPPDRYHDEYVPFALLAANNKQTINVGYSARENAAKIELYQKQLLGDFENGNLNDDALYVIMDSSLVKKDFPFHKTGVLDGYLIVAPDIPIPDLKPWPHEFIEGEKNIIAQVVEHYSKSNYIILMSVRDEAAKNLPNDLREFIKNKGGNIGNLGYAGSYIAIINDGVLINEIIDNKKMVTLTTSIDDYHIIIASAGYYVGNLSIIEVNGVSLSPNKGGFNIVIVNPENGKTLIYNYDTFRKNWDYKLPEREITLKTIRP